MKGMLLGKDSDLEILVKKDSQDKIVSGVLLSQTLLQNTFIVLQLNQGELKEDPIAGCNLLRNIRSKVHKEKIKKIVKIGLERVGIQYDEVKNELELYINQEKIS